MSISGFAGATALSAGISFYDAESPGVYLETFRVDSWGEHERQHDRFTVADRECEERVLRFALEPLKTKHFLYADRIKQQVGE